MKGYVLQKGTFKNDALKLTYLSLLSKQGHEDRYVCTLKSRTRIQSGTSPNKCKVAQTKSHTYAGTYKQLSRESKDVDSGDNQRIAEIAQLSKHMDKMVKHVKVVDELFGKHKTEYAEISARIWEYVGLKDDVDKYKFIQVSAPEAKTKEDKKKREGC